MSAEHNKELARRLFEEGFGKGNLGVLDEIMTPDAVDHTPFPGVASGREGYKQTISMIRSGFPDMKMKVEEMICEGDRVMARWTSTGTHQGEFMGVPASGKPINIGGLSELIISDGKIAGDWTQYDAIGMMTQIGAMPEGAMA
jgi:steroid delta-isomerase-like uncharacterized protein